MTSADRSAEYVRFELTPTMHAVAVAAEALRDFAERKRPWWRRRRSPIDFIPAARVVVATLVAQGQIDGSDVGRQKP